MSSSAALGALDHLTEVAPPVPDLLSPTALSLLTAVDAVPDPRHARGVRYDVRAVLVIAACAVLTGARSYVAIHEWATALGPAVLDHLGLAGAPPCEATLRRCLQAVDAPALQAALTSWTADQLVTAQAADAGRGLLPVAEARRIIAIDGKTLRGSARRNTEQEAAAAACGRGRAHLVAALDHEAGVVLAERACDMERGKGGEVATATALLADLQARGLLPGALVTADAAHTQRAHAERLHAAGAHYLFTVKGNQPTLLARCKALNWKGVPEGARIRSRGHGRIQTRTIGVLALDPCPDAGRADVPDADQEFFPHAAQMCKVVRRRGSRRGRWHSETLYAITSLDHREAHPGRLAAWLRGHWAIENRLHWVRDAAFDEDRSQVRTAAGPQVMAAFRNLAINVLRLTGWTNIAAGLRAHAQDPLLPLTTLGLN